MPRTHQGRTHRDFLGRHRRTDRVAEILSRSDGELHPLDKAELLPPGLWDLHEFVSAAAAAAGVPYETMMREAQRLLPQVLLQPSGHSRPDQESSDATPPRATTPHRR